MIKHIQSFIGFMLLTYFIAATAAVNIERVRGEEAQAELNRIRVCKYTTGSVPAYLANCAGTYHFEDGDDVVNQDGNHHVYPKH